VEGARRVSTTRDPYRPDMHYSHKPERYARADDPDQLRFVIPLPYDRPPLTLNGRGHWRVRSRESGRIRATVYAALYTLNAPKGVAHATVRLFHVPPDNRVRDADNMVPTLKACIDGLTRPRKGGKPDVAYGLVHDDNPTYVTWHPPVILPGESDPRALRLYLEVEVAT